MHGCRVCYNGIPQLRLTPTAVLPQRGRRPERRPAALVPGAGGDLLHAAAATPRRGLGHLQR